MIIETDINYTGLVYLFKGNEMLVPKGGQSAAGGADLILTGIPADLVLKTFKDNAPNYFEVPSIDKTSILPRVMHQKKFSALPKTVLFCTKILSTKMQNPAIILPVRGAKIAAK
ncbi:MAG: hypothetical protein Ta2G_10790 [Termitinemataceae bacterium]|nr:MAG: hypothetical protein Ta2G_10790 [Termitinemataceae bacterium]